jgi:hypothetical protein
VCEYQKSAKNEWQLTLQESRQTVETEVFGWDGRNFWSDNFLSLGWRKKITQPTGLDILLIIIKTYIIYIWINLYK